jgi:amino acid transporter
MKKTLRILAAVVALATAVTWLFTGASLGWTQTTVEKKTVDEVTGLVGITQEKQFRAGVDFLGGGLLGAGVLVGASFLFRNKSTNQNAQ